MAIGDHLRRPKASPAPAAATPTLTPAGTRPHVYVDEAGFWRYTPPVPPSTPPTKGTTP